MREMGGRNERLMASSASVRFCRGFFSSINDTVSITRFGAGLGVSTSFAGDSKWVRVLGAGGAGTARGPFAGVSTLALFTSLRFGSGAIFTGAAALTGLRAVAGLRATVLVVVFVGICIPEKLSWPAVIVANQFTAQPGSPDEWPHEFHPPSLHPRKESRPDLR